MSWSELGDEWVEELRSDHAYDSVVTPLLLEVLTPDSGELYLDLGCGEGRVMRTVRDLGAVVHGVELNPHLAEVSGERVVVASLPDLGFLESGSYRGAYCVLALEHVEDHETFFSEAARVVETGGSLSLVMNHPVWTAPGSTPVTDLDGEVLWRPGRYFEVARSSERLGKSTVVFHHRPLGVLLGSAARVGWSLRTAVERPHHELPDQAGIPRLLALDWANLGE